MPNVKEILACYPKLPSDILRNVKLSFSSFPKCLQLNSHTHTSSGPYSVISITLLPVIMELRVTLMNGLQPSSPATAAALQVGTFPSNIPSIGAQWDGSDVMRGKFPPPLGEKTRPSETIFLIDPKAMDTICIMVRLFCAGRGLVPDLHSFGSSNGTFVFRLMFLVKM